MTTCSKCKDGWVYESDGGQYSCDCERGKEQQKRICEICGGFDEHYPDCKDIQIRLLEAKLEQYRLAAIREIKRHMLAMIWWRNRCRSYNERQETLRRACAGHLKQAERATKAEAKLAAAEEVLLSIGNLPDNLRHLSMSLARAALADTTTDEAQP